MKKIISTIFKISFLLLLLLTSKSVFAGALTYKCDDGYSCAQAQRCVKNISTTGGPTTHFCLNDGQSITGTNPENLPQAVRDSSTGMPSFKNPLDSLQVPLPSSFMTSNRGIQCDPGEKKGEYGACHVYFLADYIAGWYKYLVGIGALLGVITAMIGGFLWIISAGNAQKIGDAKKWITNGIIGIILLTTSYIILYQVNPDLIALKAISLDFINKDESVPEPEDIADFTGRCKPTTSGNCAISNMSAFGVIASQASAICMAESGGKADAYNKSTGCTNGGYAVWGMFQFNLSANTFYDGSVTLNCPKAFGNKAWVNSSKTCTITDRALYDKCVTAASNPQLSIQNARRLTSSAKTTWGPWEANSKWCKF